MDSQTLIDVAQEAARLAAAEALAIFGRNFIVEQKAKHDLVTEADKAAQNIIVDHLRSHFPTHAFLAEEDDASLSADGDVVWIIDPIDGTTNFSRKVPFFSISIGAAVDGQLVAGLVYDPNHNEMYHAQRGKGAFMNETPLTCSTRDLDTAIVAFSPSRKPALRAKTLRMMAHIAPRIHTYRSVGSAALTLCYIAAGKFEAYVNFGLKAWDVAGGALILQEAGGKMYGRHNEPFSIEDEASWDIASNQAVADDMLEAAKA